MSDEVKSRLFEPFFTTKQDSGTGLGLASVRSLVEAQGGSIRVTSELGVGTAVTLSWPLARRGVSRSETPLLDASGPPVVVLLVDDDEQVRSVLTRGLTHFGLTVLGAADGGAGLERAFAPATPRLKLDFRPTLSMISCPNLLPSPSSPAPLRSLARTQ